MQPTKSESIWEEIPIEETETHFQETGKTENIPVIETVQGE